MQNHAWTRFHPSPGFHKQVIPGQPNKLQLKEQCLGYIYRLSKKIPPTHIHITEPKPSNPPKCDHEKLMVKFLRMD